MQNVVIGTAKDGLGLSVAVSNALFPHLCENTAQDLEISLVALAEFSSFKEEADFIAEFEELLRLEEKQTDVIDASFFENTDADPLIDIQNTIYPGFDNKPEQYEYNQNLLNCIAGYCDAFGFDSIVIEFEDGKVTNIKTSLNEDSDADMTLNLDPELFDLFVEYQNSELKSDLVLEDYLEKEVIDAIKDFFATNNVKRARFLTDGYMIYDHEPIKNQSPAKIIRRALKSLEDHLYDNYRGITLLFEADGFDLENWILTDGDEVIPIDDIIASNVSTIMAVYEINEFDFVWNDEIEDTIEDIYPLSAMEYIELLLTKFELQVQKSAFYYDANKGYDDIKKLADEILEYCNAMYGNFALDDYLQYGLEVTEFIDLVSRLEDQTISLDLIMSSDFDITDTLLDTIQEYGENADKLLELTGPSNIFVDAFVKYQAEIAKVEKYLEIDSRNFEDMSEESVEFAVTNLEEYLLSNYSSRNLSLIISIVPEDHKVNLEDVENILDDFKDDTLVLLSDSIRDKYCQDMISVAWVDNILSVELLDENPFDENSEDEFYNEQNAEDILADTDGHLTDNYDDLVVIIDYNKGIKTVSISTENGDLVLVDDLYGYDSTLYLMIEDLSEVLTLSGFQYVWDGNESSIEIGNLELDDYALDQEIPYYDLEINLLGVDENGVLELEDEDIKNYFSSIYFDIEDPLSALMLSDNSFTKAVYGNLDSVTITAEDNDELSDLGDLSDINWDLVLDSDKYYENEKIEFKDIHNMQESEPKTINVFDQGYSVVFDEFVKEGEE